MSQNNVLQGMPRIIPPRPAEDDKPDLYEESDRDWMDNNRDFVKWLRQNYKRLNNAIKEDE